MTTKNFSAIKLPHPKCSLELGCFDLNQTDLNLSIWIPRFSDSAHVIEVRKTGTTSPGQFSSYVNELMAGSHIVIDNARPELFFRRDFITQFVGTGKIHLVQNYEQTNGFTANSGGFDETSLNHYQIFTKNNVLSLILSEKQYRRFGLVGKKLLPHKRGNPKPYRIDVDLKDERIRTSNKYQDKLVQTFRRLGPISKLYFRFSPQNLTTSGDVGVNSNIDTNKLSPNIDDCLEFFKYVINEYTTDGFQPVPLTGCSKISHKPDKRWMNCSQLHPSLDLSTIIRRRQKSTIDTNNKPLELALPKTRSSSNNKKSGTKRMEVKGENGDDLAAAGKDQQDSASLVVEYIQRSSEELGKIVDITDWLGYQLLSLDCDREEISSRYPTDQERLDVSCAQICGVIDFELIHDNLGRIFKTPLSSLSVSLPPTTTDTATTVPGGATTMASNNEDSQKEEEDSPDVVLRALILYESGHRSELANSTSVVLLQDCTARRNREQQILESESQFEQQQVVITERIGSRKRQRRQPQVDSRQLELELKRRQLREELIVSVKSNLVQM